MTLPLTPTAALQARHEIRAQLVSWYLAEHADTVELIVTELVTNAMQHGEPRGTVAVALAADAQRIRVSVIDASALRPVARQVEADETSGRGMRIVEALADRWGVDDLAGGRKEVWVEVSTRRIR